MSELKNEVDAIEKDILEMKSNLTAFLKNMYVPGGLIRHSLSGDKANDYESISIGSAVYALKTGFILGFTKEEQIIKEAINEIKRFKHESGYIYSDKVDAKARLLEGKERLKKIKWPYKKISDYMRAETRQSMSALLTYGVTDFSVPTREVLCSDEIVKFIDGYDWSKPWNAGSHLSHLMFFENVAHRFGKIDDIQFNRNYEMIVNKMNSMQSDENGSWYKGNPTSKNIVNGAMKVLTGFHTIGEVGIDEEHAKLLIDYCLKEKNNGHACDNFNITYVICRCSEVCPNYRRGEIEEFAIDRYKIYKQYYYPQYGGFSFYKHKASDYYYGTRISCGKDEPDIHGTVMFTWGLYMIAKLLRITENVGLKEIVS